MEHERCYNQGEERTLRLMLDGSLTETEITRTVVGLARKFKMEVRYQYSNELTSVSSNDRRGGAGVLQDGRRKVAGVSTAHHLPWQ